MSELAEILVGSRKGEIAEVDRDMRPIRGRSTTIYLWLRSLEGEPFGWYRESEVRAVPNTESQP